MENLMKEKEIINRLRNALLAVEDAQFAKQPYPREVVLAAIQNSWEEPGSQESMASAEFKGGYAMGYEAAKQLYGSNVKALYEQQVETLDKHVAKLLVTMQAAMIEWAHGKGPEAALQWIANTLDGPGLIPDPEEPYGKNAQFFYSANRPDPFPKCFCGNPSHIEYMGNGFCCNAHFREANAKHDSGKSA